MSKKEKKSIGEHTISSGEDRKQTVVVYEEKGIRYSITKHYRKDYGGNYSYSPNNSFKKTTGALRSHKK